MLIKGIAEVVINVHDLRAMTAFYQSVLGFAFHSQFPEMDPTLVFLRVADLDSPLGRGGHPQLVALLDPKRHVFTHDSYAGLDHERSPLNHIAFEIDSGEFTSARKRQEMHLAVDVRDFPQMQASALFFNDPEGNHIELICHRSPMPPKP